MERKNVALMEFENNPNIGLFMFANDKFCLLGKEVDQAKRKEIEKILEVPIYECKALGTDLIGVFITGNNEYIITPSLFEHERKILDEIAGKHDIKIVEVDHKLNTLGNGICIGEKEFIIGSHYPKPVKELIEKETGYKGFILENKEFSGAGSVMLYKNGKYFISQELEEEDIKGLGEKLAGAGSANSGSPYISSGAVGNSNGLLLGSMCSTVEIQNLVESLDYI